MWFFWIHQYYKWFSDRLKFSYSPCLRIFIIFRQNICNRSIGCYHDSYRCMFMNHFLCTDHRCLGKWYFFLIPRSLYHTFMPGLLVSRSTLYHISDTVNQTDPYFNILVQTYHCSIFRYKFGLCCHNRLACRRLRKFVSCPLFLMFIFHSWQHHYIHKAFDKCRFSCSYRSDNADIDFSVCSRFYIFI